jgi:hypothetical protein
MKWNQTLLMVGSTALAVLAGALLHSPVSKADDWDEYNDAERSAKDLLYSYEDFKKLDRSEVQSLVNAICQAEEEERKSVASDIGSRAREKVRSEYDKVERRKNEALDKLKKVIADDRFKDKRSDAESLKSQVEERWKSIDRMYDSMRGSNHPVVSFMLDKGKEEHDYREGRCTAREFETGNGRADCIGYDGNACLIVEFKPNNSRAISKGKEQLKDQSEALEKNADKRKELDDKSSSFSSCPKKFDTRVDCYMLCPEIDEEANFKSTSTSWSTDCR